MNGRPWLLRIAPPRLREPLVHAWYLRDAASQATLFQSAPLYFAPSVRMRLAATDVGHAAIALAGIFEYRLSKRIAALARRGGLLVDVGANYGYYTLLWAAARPDNRVLALEASPRNIAPLLANIHDNGFDPRAAARQVAAGRVTGTVRLELGPPEQTGWAGIAPPGESGTTEVPAVRLDDLAAQEHLAHIDVLKVDVEGADTWVLQGAERLLAERRITHVFFERNDARMASLGLRFDDTLRFLDSVGYRARPVSANEWHAMPVP